MLLKSVNLYSRIIPRKWSKLDRVFTNEIAFRCASSIFRCNEHNPVNHTINYDSQFYVIPPEIKETIFSHGGISKDYQKDIKTFREFSVMIRKPALEIIEYLKKADYSTPVIRYVLYGDTGVGKSTSLIHLLHFAAAQNWLIVHLPWAPLWIRACKEWTPSQSRERRIDQPKEAVAWLQQFKTQNANLLKTVEFKTSQSYTWSKRESTDKDKPITDVIEQGLNRIKFSSDCVAVLLKELKTHASAGKFRAFVVIDGVNALFSSSTRIKREDKSVVDANDLTLVRAFRKIIRNDWKNGAVVTTVDSIANHSDFRETIFPFYLLGKDGFETMDPFIPVRIEKYSPQEANNCLDYYIERNWIQTEGARSEEGKKELCFLSGRNPEKLAKLCASW